MLYRRISFSLRNSGRDIFLAACQWGTEQVENWISSCGAHSYRSTTDIQDSWNSIRSIADQRLAHLEDGHTGCWNDMDMLVVGMNGKGLNPETSAQGCEGCSEEEYQSHFALWCMLNSPLIIGGDVRTLDEKAKKLLKNRDLIGINQDPEGRNCYKLTCPCSPGAFTLIHPLSRGRYTIGIFNIGEKELMTGFPFWDMGLSICQGQKLNFYDCLKHEGAGIFAECFSTAVPAHGCRVYLCSAV